MKVICPRKRVATESKQILCTHQHFLENKSSLPVPCQSFCLL